MLSPAAVLRSLRNISLFSDSSSRRRRRRRSAGPAQELSDEDSLLHHLPVDVQLLILTFLCPRDLCRLGATCHYWSWMVRDPLLWRYFLIRDAARWSSVDHLSTPRLHFLTEPAGGDTETGTDADTEAETERLDYMAEYLRCCPECRSPQRCTPPSALSFFLHSLVSDTEPRFSMFGSGLEQLDVSLMTVMMNSPNVLSVAGIPQRQINGIGSGISFVYDGQHKFNIITLYSTNSAERERARVERSRVNSKLFVHEDDGTGSGRYSVAPQFQEVFRSVNGFIYIANAETQTAIREDEYAQISAVVQPVFGPPSRPLLVLSCVSRDGETQRKSACVSVAHQLQLNLLPNPWMVQDVVAESLSGLLEGIAWLLRHSGLRV